MTFTTSNKQKIKEIRRLFPNVNIINGKDLPEVDGTWLEVITHKAIDAGTGFVVEDTILEIDGVEVVDIRWNQEDKLKNTQKVVWRVSFGYNDGEKIKIWTGITNGIIVEPNIKGYSFDPYILPDGFDITVAQLDKENRKDEVSPRKKALLNLKNKKPEFILPIIEVPQWNGKYQTH